MRWYIDYVRELWNAIQMSYENSTKYFCRSIAVGNVMYINKSYVYYVLVRGILYHPVVLDCTRICPAMLFDIRPKYVLRLNDVTSNNQTKEVNYDTERYGIDRTPVVYGLS